MKEDVARDLLTIQAVFLRPKEPFTWASGIKSPIYTDNRLILSAPEERNRIEQALADMIQQHYPDVEMLMGTATAGIAHAALAADRLRLPMGYVRSGAKDHGRQNRIEGKLQAEQKVVVVEDLISTGGSVLEVVEALREAGANVLGIACLFTYNMEKSQQRLQLAKVPMCSLTDFDTVLQVAVEEGKMSESEIPKLKHFRENPSDASWMEI